MTEQSFSLSTKRAAEIAGVPQYILLSAFKRHGHYLGVAPRKQPNGRHLWPAATLYQALGRLPQQGRATPATRARQHICTHTGADPFQVQQATEHLFSDQPKGDTPAERLAYMLARIDHLSGQASAVAGLTRETLADEDHLTLDDWRRLNWAAEHFTQAAASVARPMLWRTAPPPAAASIFGAGRRDIGGAE